ncbi:ABC transporter permease [Pseudarthrobacter sp. J1738]|uniref:ABC transporter permease n=1 Tax=unclassified Pseudarthrobacter TaxID=2647000 RepID=UPI003D2CA55F
MRTPPKSVEASGNNRGSRISQAGRDDVHGKRQGSQLSNRRSSENSRDPGSKLSGQRGTQQWLAEPPLWVFLLGGLAVVLLILPPAAMAARVDWGNFVSLVSSPSSVTALWLSIRTALASTLLCLVLGVPLAALLARTNFRGKSVLRALVLLPLVLPPVVGGLALLYTFGRRGLLGHSLEVLGVQIAFSTTAVVIAQTFVALPYLVLSVEGALTTAGSGFEATAATLGASPRSVFWRITLPLVFPGLLAGAVLSFARSLGEFGATLTFAGSLEGTTRTLPLEIYLQRETDPDAAVALSVLLVVIAVIVVALVHRVPRKSAFANVGAR